MTARNHTLDHIKAIACLTIVLHHLVFYSPMADVVRPAVPALVDALRDQGRMAVQVFLVLGGYLAASALAPQGLARHSAFWQPLGQRFVRLSVPYSAALVVALVVNETVGGLGFDHPSVSETPTWDGVLAHLLLLHSVGDWNPFPPGSGMWPLTFSSMRSACCGGGCAASKPHGLGWARPAWWWARALRYGCGVWIAAWTCGRCTFSVRMGWA